MRYRFSYLIALSLLAVARDAQGHGFDLFLTRNSQNTPVVITPSSEQSLDYYGDPIAPQNLFIDSFDPTYYAIHGFAATAGSWPTYTATYNILSPLYFSDGTSQTAATAGSGTTVVITNRDVGLFPGATTGSLTLSGTSGFQTGYGVSLVDPHELQKVLTLASGSTQSYGMFGFAYQVSIALSGGQTLTSGPLVDVFATTSGSDFFDFASAGQQDTAARAIYNAAIAVPQKWNFNGNSTFSTVGRWTSTAPNGLGFTAQFGTGGSVTVSASTVAVTMDKAIYMGSLQFSNATTSYTLATDNVAGHGLTLDNNGVGATVSVTAGSHSISTPLQLNDTGGTKLTIASGSTLSITGWLADTATSQQITVGGAGTLRIASQPSFVSGTTIAVSGAKLKLDASSGAASIGSGVSISVSGAGTLELAGSVPTLKGGSGAATIINTATGGGGILASHAGEVAGILTGGGDVTIGAGAGLTVNSLNQGKLTIGSGGVLHLAASDSHGNTLAETSGLTGLLLNGQSSLAAMVSGQASMRPAGEANVFGSVDGTGTVPTTLADGTGTLRTTMAVPEPPGLALAAMAAAALCVVYLRSANRRRTRDGGLDS